MLATPLVAIALVVAVAVVAAGAWTANTPTAKRKRGFSGNIHAIAENVLPGPPPSERSEEMGDVSAAAMADWRTAILTRNAEVVGRVDAAFVEAPDRYVDALRNSAMSDADERVRAFSTRELGKFKRVELVSSFEQLMGDKSPFVRKNAAWALGELNGQSETRAAARHALTDLRRLAAGDPVEDVRAAARRSLEQLR